MTSGEVCRCGHPEGKEPHPCHGRGYQCGHPAKRRFYNPSLVSLAGVMLKVQVSDTWACDACWQKFGAAQKPVQG